MRELTDKDLIRIEKLLEVSRTSDFPGEAANALAAARRIAAEAGHDLDALMAEGPAGAARTIHRKSDEEERERWRRHPREAYAAFTTVMYAAEQAAKLARDRERMAAEARRMQAERNAKEKARSTRRPSPTSPPDLSSPILSRYKQRMDRIRRR